jgi:hypothetical protein
LLPITTPFGSGIRLTTIFSSGRALSVLLECLEKEMGAETERKKERKKKKENR